MKFAATAFLSSSLAAGSGSIAVSPEGRFVDEQFLQGFKGLRSSESIGYTSTLAELDQLVEECSTGNWDGYGARPVSRDSSKATARFLNMLPLGTPRPSVGADPDGEITLEWHAAPRRTLSVSIASDGMLHYAALLGAAVRYGSEPFLGGIPFPILDLIRQIGCA
jgi:hypothetical protein